MCSCGQMQQNHQNQDMKAAQQPQVSLGPEQVSCSHLGLSQLPLGSTAVVQVQQLDAAASGIIGQHHASHQHLVPEHTTSWFLLKVLRLVWFTETGSLVQFEFNNILVLNFTFQELMKPEMSSMGSMWREPSPSRQNKIWYLCFCKGLIWVRRDTPAAEVLERSPHGEAGASDLDRLQHAGISELVQNQRLVELVRHLEAETQMFRSQSQNNHVQAFRWNLNNVKEEEHLHSEKRVDEWWKFHSQSSSLTPEEFLYIVYSEDY